MFAKNGNAKNGFLTDFKRLLFSQIISFFKSKFTVIYICMTFIFFINLNIVFLRDNTVLCFVHCRCILLSSLRYTL